MLTLHRKIKQTSSSPTATPYTVIISASLWEVEGNQIDKEDIHTYTGRTNALLYTC